MIYPGDRPFKITYIYFGKSDIFSQKMRKNRYGSKEKLRKLSFVKNQMMKEGLENINDVEPTICQIFEDVLGIGSEYTIRLIKFRDKIFKSCYNGGIIILKFQHTDVSCRNCNPYKWYILLKLLCLFL